MGTSSRWDVIAAYINEHSGSEKGKTGKQVINKVKSLKKLGMIFLIECLASKSKFGNSFFFYAVSSI